MAINMFKRSTIQRKSDLPSKFSEKRTKKGAYAGQHVSSGTIHSLRHIESTSSDVDSSMPGPDFVTVLMPALFS
jgi:hypothetical protein